ncbi:hypothetical protein ACFOD4_08450 [Pseudoroseomonas globiformis]|uniref:DUF4258 domain-containing protein n=1 Tax=Teichococcus globiformis TaxID=2307229 RepID=A0ABV7FXJ1_9PROT
MKPGNDLELVRRLAADESSCAFFDVVIAELHSHKMDSDDLRDIIATELGEAHCYDSQETRKHRVPSTSDYYSIWVDECGAHMFLKLLVDAEGVLWVTSFKKDNRHD